MYLQPLGGAPTRMVDDSFVIVRAARTSTVHVMAAVACSDDRDDLGGCTASKRPTSGPTSAPWLVAVGLLLILRQVRRRSLPRA